jgi:hypothetical protein
MQDSKPYFTKSNYAPVAGFLPLRLARLFSNLSLSTCSSTMDFCHHVLHVYFLLIYQVQFCSSTWISSITLCSSHLCTSRWISDLVFWLFYLILLFPYYAVDGFRPLRLARLNNNSSLFTLLIAFIFFFFTSASFIGTSEVLAPVDGFRPSLFSLR